MFWKRNIGEILQDLGLSMEYVALMMKAWSQKELLTSCKLLPHETPCQEDKQTSYMVGENTFKK